MKNYEPPADLLRDRVILITGAGDRIGRAAAESFAAHGATVVLLGRTVAKLEAAYDAIEAAGHPQPAIYPMNLESAGEKDYGELAETFRREFGRLDGLLHNAAQLGTLTPMEHYPPEQWYRVIQVNVHAPFLLTRACLPVLKESPDASILFTSSSVGREGRAYWGAYAVSNFAVEGIMQVLADELEVNTHIRVNSIDPGPVRTAMFRQAYPARDSRSVPEPHAVMNSYLFLMGPDSRDMNGKTLSAQPGP